MSFNPWLIMVIACLALIIFTLFIGYHLFKQNKISCNCFGGDERSISFYDLFRNILLIFFSVIFVRFSSDDVASLQVQFLCLSLALLLFLIVSNLHLIGIVVKGSREISKNG